MNSNSTNASTTKTGLDFSFIDVNIRPQDDLFRHFNGKWLENAEIPADRASDGAFYTLYETAEKQVRNIIEELAAKSDPTPLEMKIGGLYQSFMDEAGIEARGISPISNYLAKVDTLSNIKEFLKFASELDGAGFISFFYLFINTDDKDSSKYSTFIGQSGISLPDEAFYREEAYNGIRTEFKAHIARILGLAGISEANAKAELVLELETKIASHHWDQVKCREAELIYNPMDLAGLQKLMSNFSFSNWASDSSTPISVISEVIVHQPSFFTGLDTLFVEENLDSWKAWLAWQLIHETAPMLSSEFVNENFAFYGKVLSGTPKLRDRWKRGVSLVESLLGEAVGEIYVSKHFPPAAKEKMLKLVGNLITAYRVSISELDWMGAETKQRAYEKLDSFMPKIGYPDKWRDYSKLEIKNDDLIGNLANANRFGRDYEFSKLGKPVDRSIWFMTPQTVNAYYNPGLNEIVFPAAILQPPFFDMEADDAANYGGIGAVIGHEIGHGFDDQGAKYDAKGNLFDWWQEADKTEFEKRAAKLINQYNQLTPKLAPEVKVNGALTIGENIGDLGGLSIAYRAYRIANPNPAVIDGLTGDQRFFFGWAQVWRGKSRPEEIKRRIAIDPHSPEEFRCNQVVKNVEAFYQCFEVKAGDGLYLDPAERVKIW